MTASSVPIPDHGGVVHLQLRRFAGCPVCNLHLRGFIRRRDDLIAAGIREVIVFHSTDQALLEHERDLPFDVIGDPDKRIYAEFGAEASTRSLLSVRAWPAITKAVIFAAYAMIRYRRPMPPLRPDGGRFGLPMDLLIDRSGRVLATHFGEHADDQWSVDDVLGLVDAASAPCAGADSTLRS